MKKLNISKRICALLMVLVLVLSQVFASVIVFADDAVPKVYVENNGSRLVAKVENFTATSYQWQRALKNGEEYGEYADINGATLKHYDITTEDEGALIRVVANKTQSNSGIASDPTDKPIGKLVVFDLAKGGVTFNTSYSGKDSAGNTVSGTHVATNIYVVKQSNKETMTTNSIDFKGDHPSNPFDLTLAGVNMGEIPTKHDQSPGSGGTNTPSLGQITIPANNGEIKHVVIRLKDENIVRHIRYYNGGDTQIPASVKSSLKFTDINGDGATDGGSLYMPIKLAPDEIENFIKTQTDYNHWNAGIGGNDSNSLVQNLTIAGGKLQVVTTLGDNCTAIGAGGNGYCQMEITGGEVIAHCNGTGAAIGGGIGWNAAGGPADIVISGGNVYAKNHSRITSGEEIVGGVAIGGGSSFHKDGSRGNVSIIGATVEAYGTFGNGIGGGNSSTSKGGGATININSGNVTASSIGGGNSKKGTAGDATVTVNSPANVMLTGGIGGGTSESGDGGDAAITVNGGTLNCGGVIGGGNGGLTGNGGKATVTVNNGKLTATSVGGGTGGTSGNGGAAEIYINGGAIETGSIGGGDTLNATGKLGYAKGVITGGDIRGQFLMVAGGTDKCTFEMSGGTLHGVNALDNTKYTKANGAAVYMDDAQGEVTITGGTISDCNAQKGGAIYMTAGTFTIGNDLAETEESTKATITGCEATEDGGAVYLGGGMMIVKNNAIITNNEAGRDGGAAYVGKEGIAEKGLVEVSGGLISNNTAAINGGGISMADGDFMMYGGKVTHNSATTGNGGGIYVSSDTVDVNVSVRSGEVSNNCAKLSGGAVAVVGDEANDSQVIDTTIGVKDLHYKKVGNNDYERIDCEHAPIMTLADDSDSIQVKPCPVFKDNRGDRNGGAVYIAGNENANLKVYCLIESGSVSGGDKNQSDFLKVEGGRVIFSTSEIDDKNSQDSLHGNIDIGSTLYATKGKFDIYGSTKNPLIKNTMTVDIEDNTKDYLKDWRKQEGIYKLLYFENFTEPGASGPTGQYKSVDVIHGTYVEISGNVYEHPGYEIQGWNTAADGSDYWKQKEQPDQDKGYYDVSEKYLFNNKPIGDLTIYAIWKANGYEVYYWPNCDTYDGKMDATSFKYDESVALDENKFTRDGYEFVGWSMSPTPAAGEKIYADKEVVKNLTTEKGKKVYLYAQWKVCDHNHTTHKYEYKVVDGTMLQRTCSCSGYTESAVIIAEDSVYNKDAINPATVSTSYKWEAGLEHITPTDGVWPPAITYTRNDQVFVGTPKNAGTYVASISATDKDGVTHVASLSYIIEKAEQPKPEKPVFEASKDGTDNRLFVKAINQSALGTVGKAEYDSTYDSKAEYKLEYYKDGVKEEVGWFEADNIADAYAYIFTLDYSYTKYSIYARYGEGTNYKASSEVKADRDYVFAGEVGLKVSCGEGVDYEVVIPKEGYDVTIAGNGIQLKIWTKVGDHCYYIPNGYIPTVITKETATGNIRPEGSCAEIEGGSVLVEGKKETRAYTIENIITKSTLELTIPDAKHVPTVEGKIGNKEIFGSVTTTAATISRDSAFTASFDVKYYDYREYNPLKLLFSTNLPKGTTIIMLDKGTGTYYRYVVSAPTNSVDLENDFFKMGTDSTKFDLEHRGSDMLLQFVVDFSDTTDGVLGDDIETRLVASQKRDQLAVFNITNMVKSFLEDISSFDLSAVKEDLVTKLEYVFNKSEGATSKHDGKFTSIVLTPSVQSVQIPSDAYIKYTAGTHTSNIYRNSDGSFVVPIGALASGEVDLSIVSSQFTNDLQSFNFAARWMASKSTAAVAPMNGTKLAEDIDITLDGVKPTTISVKSILQNLVYSKRENTMSARVLWRDLPLNYDFTVTLMYKNDAGNYVNTGWNYKIEYQDSEGFTDVRIPISNFEPGEYYLRVTVERGLVKMAETQSYFMLNNDRSES